MSLVRVQYRPPLTSLCIGACVMKIAIFFDGQNFYRSLLRYDESLRVDYDRLAAWITQQIGGPNALFSGAYYYVGVSSDAPPLVEGFLKGLELRPGYFVKREPRVRRAGRCPACGQEYEYTTEKRVDTRLVADLIHYAAANAFAAAAPLSGGGAVGPGRSAPDAPRKRGRGAPGAARCPAQKRGARGDGDPQSRVQRQRARARRQRRALRIAAPSRGRRRA